MQEESFTVTLKLAHTDGIIESARLLKARSKLPDEILTKINKLFAATFDPPTEVKTTVALGNLGEQVILSHLNAISRNNADFCVFDTSSQKGHGDIAVEYKGNKICIEVKNYTKPIPGKEIDKYHGSLGLPDYHMGMLISMNEHGFAREYGIRSPIDIRVIDGKPTAYLSGVDVELLYSIITVLASLRPKEDIAKADDSNIDTLALQAELDKKTMNLQAILGRTQEMKRMIAVQKTGLLALEEMLTGMQVLALD